jgi:signal transduction histidine kinase
VSIFRPRGGRTTIRTRILLIAWVPSLLLLLVGVGLSGIFARQSIKEKDFTKSYLEAVRRGSNFAIADQRERELTVEYLLNPGQSRHDLDVQRLQTQAALNQTAAMRTIIDRYASPSFRRTIERSGAGIGALVQMRQGVDSGAVTAREAVTAYTQALEVFHASLESLATDASTASIAAENQLTANLFRLAEWRSQSEAYERMAYGPTGLTDQEVGEYLDLVGGYHSLLAITLPRLPAAEQATFKALMGSTAWQNTSLVEDTVVRGVAGGGPTSSHRVRELPINQANWDAASAEVSRMMINQFLQHVTYSTRLATDHANSVLRLWLLTGAGLLLLSLLVFAVVTRMSNRLIQRLRRLRSDTLELAGERLPSIVARLSQGAQVDVASELPPLDHGKDEIGQVADAFNQAQRTAVEAAAKEAETRAGTSKVFLNIAHRSQIVAHRQLKLLDQAERTQEDPDQLSLLFQLDHLTTRARRNAENLIILGGGQPGRRWRNPVPLLDVVRSAVGEAETYTGISIGQMPQAAVAGAAVADIIHLLAELVDNATSFSPPTARVEVRANVAGRGIVIEVEDQGLGIEPDQLNELNTMLQSPPDFSMMALSEEPRLGLFVVTRLAARHGVRVTLTESPSYGGIRAVVLLPMELITSSTRPEVEGGAVTRRELREAMPTKVEVIGSVLPTRKSSRMISLAPSAPLPSQSSQDEGSTDPDPRPAPAQPTGQYPTGQYPTGQHAGGPHPSDPYPSDPYPSDPYPSDPYPADPAGTYPAEQSTAESPAAGSLTADPPIAPITGAGSMPSPFSRGFIAPPLRTSPARTGRVEDPRRTSEIPVIQPSGAPVLRRSTRPESSPTSPTSPTGPAGSAGPGQDQRPALPRRNKQTHIAPQLLRDGRMGVEPPPPEVESHPAAEIARDRLAAFQRGTRQGRQSEPGSGQ